MLINILLHTKGKIARFATQNFILNDFLVQLFYIEIINDLAQIALQVYF
jgi:hypothetical protein